MSDQLYPAWLWDGKHQLSGVLKLDQNQLTFKPENFSKGNLCICIQYAEIRSMEEFLLYDLTRNGLRIETQNGIADAFILEDSVLVRNMIKNRISQ